MNFPQLLLGDDKKKKFIADYSPICSLHSDRPLEQPERCFCCGKPLQAEYFIFSYSHNGSSETFFAGPTCGRKLLEFSNQSMPPKFNPFLDVLDEPAQPLDVGGREREQNQRPQGEPNVGSLVERNADSQEFLDASGLFLYIQHPNYDEDDWVLKLHGQFRVFPTKQVTAKIAETLNEIICELCTTHNAGNLRILMQQLYPNRAIKNYEFPHIESKLREQRIVSFL